MRLEMKHRPIVVILAMIILLAYFLFPDFSEFLSAKTDFIMIAFLVLFIVLFLHSIFSMKKRTEANPEKFSDENLRRQGYVSKKVALFFLWMSVIMLTFLLVVYVYDLYFK